jgi:hypothetical protein
MTNIDIVYEKPGGILSEAPEYFQKTDKEVPEPSEFKNW